LWATLMAIYEMEGLLFIAEGEEVWENASFFP
jgi:hypothetical protein